MLVQANTTGATKNIAKVQNQLVTTDKAGSRLGSVLKTALKAGAIGAGAGLFYAVNKAADFEQVMSDLESATDSNAKTMDRFKKQAMAAGAATKFSALEAAQAQTELAKGGLSVQNIMKGGLKSALALAAAGDMDLADAAETTVNAMKLFGIQGKDSMKVADALATAARKTTGDVADFAMALKMGGASAKIAGYDLQQTVGVLEALAEAGVKNSDAGTSMKSFFLQIATPSKQARKAMKDLNLELFDAQGNFKSLPAVSKELQDSFGSLTKQQFLNKAGIIAGSDAIRTLYALYAAGPQKLSAYEKANRRAGTAADVAAKKQDNFRGKLENLQGSIETIGISIGLKLLPKLTELIDTTNKIVNAKDLTGAQKIERITKVWTKAAADALIAGGKALIKVAPTIAKGFWNAFKDMSLGGKILTTFVVYKMLFGGSGGASGSFGRAGTMAGTSFSGAFRGAIKGTIAAAIGQSVAEKIGDKLSARGGILGKIGGVLSQRGSTVANPLFVAVVNGGMPGKTPGGRSTLGKAEDAVTKGGALRALGVVTKTGGAAGIILAPLVVADQLEKGGLKGNRDSATGRLGAFGKTPGPPSASLSQQTRNAPKEQVGGTNEASTAAAVSKGVEVQKKAHAALRASFALTRSASAVTGKQLQGDMRASAAVTGARTAAIGKAFQAMRGGVVGSVGQLHKLISGTFTNISATMGTKSKEGRKALDTNFRLGVRSIIDFKQRGVLNTRQAGDEIAALMKNRAKRGKEGLADNMTKAVDAIRTSMSRAGKVTDTGTALIRRLMVTALQSMGISGKDAKLAVKQGGSTDDMFRTLGHARGGFIQAHQQGGGVVPGTGSGDRPFGTLPAGAFVMNRKATKAFGLRRGGQVPVALEPGERYFMPHEVAKIGARKLAAMNAAIPRFQEGGEVKRLAKGGGIGGMVGAANRLEQAHFPYKWGGGHQGSPAPFGPMDCSGAVSFVLQHGGVKIPTMTSGLLANAGASGPGKVTVFANNTHTFMRIGNRYFGTSGSNPDGGAGWFPDPGDSYKADFAQRHFAAGGNFATKIPRIELTGRDGSVKELAQGALDKTRGAANKKLDKLAATAFGAGDAGDPGPTVAGSYQGSLNKTFGRNSSTTIGFDQAAMLAEKAGLPGITYAQIAIGESGLRPGAVSPDGGYGLWQMTPRVQSAETVAKWKAIGSYFNPWANARMAKVLAGGGTGVSNYFGTGSVTDWNAHYRKGGKDPHGKIPHGKARHGVQPHQMGGLVQGLQKGGAVGETAKKSQWGQGISAKEFPSFVGSVWKQAKGLAHFKGPEPKFVRGGATGENYADTLNGMIHFSKPMLTSLARPGSPNWAYALQSILHEIAHTQQEVGGTPLAPWEREGGADLWAGWAGPQIFPKLGIKSFSTAPFGYPAWANKLAKTVSPTWWKIRQFGLGRMWARDQRNKSDDHGDGKKFFASGIPMAAPKPGRSVGRAAYVGDSLGEGTLAAGLKGKLGKIALDSQAITGKSSSWGVGALKGLLKKDTDVGVFDLGTNDGTAGNMTGPVGSAKKMLGQRPMVMATIVKAASDAAKKNQLIKRQASTVVDWASVANPYLGSDGIHASTTGYARRASMIAGAVKKQTSAGAVEGIIEKVPDHQKKVKPKKNRLIDRRTVGGGLPGQFKTTIETLRQVSGRTKFGRLLRNKKVDKLLKKVKSYGVLPEGLDAKMAKLTEDAATYGEFAERAGTLTTDAQDADGNPIADAQGRQLVNWFPINGKIQPEWLQVQLNTMFELRNAVAKALRILKKRKIVIAKLVSRTQAILKQVQKQFKEAQQHQETLHTQLKKLQDEKPKDAKGKKEKKRKIDLTKIALDEIEGKQKDRIRFEKSLKQMLGSADNGGLLGGQAAVVAALGGPDDGIIATLDGLQGKGGTDAHLLALPALGGLGGTIAEVQKALVDLGIPREKVTDTSGASTTTESTELLQQLLREANLRTAVSQRQFDIFKNFDATSGLGNPTAFLGAFAKGGVALLGEKGPELAHLPSGTRVHSAEDTRSIVAPNIAVHINGDIVNTPRGKDPVEVLLNDRRFKAAIGNAPLGRRGPLPGAGGGGFR